MNVDDLVKAFEQLPENEQKEVFKRIMSTMCGQFRQNPQQMMAEMMPLCREMMQGCGVDPGQMMEMMQKMREKSSQ